MLTNLRAFFYRFIYCAINSGRYQLEQVRSVSPSYNEQAQVRRSLEADISRMRDERHRADMAAMSEQARLTRDLSDLRTKLRDQTEADLVMISLKIIRNALTDKPIVPELIAQQSALQNHLAALNNPRGYGGLGFPTAARGLF